MTANLKENHVILSNKDKKYDIFEFFLQCMFFHYSHRTNLNK